MHLSVTAAPHVEIYPFGNLRQSHFCLHSGVETYFTVEAVSGKFTGVHTQGCTPSDILLRIDTGKTYCQ